MEEAEMSILDGIDPSDVKEFLGKGWLTHDGMWFLNVYQAYGIDAANEPKVGLEEPTHRNGERGQLRGGRGDHTRAR